jgi:hypothetical protein
VNKSAHPLQNWILVIALIILWSDGVKCGFGILFCCVNNYWKMNVIILPEFISLLSFERSKESNQRKIARC